jgi:hypothetical protein
MVLKNGWLRQLFSCASNKFALTSSLPARCPVAEPSAGTAARPAADNAGTLVIKPF